MPTVAEQLRQAREARGFTVHQLADLTKMRTDHLRALEEGDYNVFSAPVYIRGFVRTLAGMLKLDAKALLAELDAELGQTKKFKEAPRLTGESRGIVDWLTLQLSKVNWRVALPLLALAVIAGAGLVAFRVWHQRETKDPLRNLGPGLYQPKRTTTADTLPLPPANPAPAPTHR